MKKIAISLGLAFVSFGVFGQATVGNGSTPATASVTSKSARKEPLKATSMQEAQAKKANMAATGSQNNAKPQASANGQTKSKPTSMSTNSGSGQKPAASAKGTTTHKKKRHAHHSNGTGKPAGTTEKSATGKPATTKPAALKPAATTSPKKN